MAPFAPTLAAFVPPDLESCPVFLNLPSLIPTPLLPSFISALVSSIDYNIDYTY